MQSSIADDVEYIETELDTGGVHLRAWLVWVGSQVRFYTIIADRVGSRVSPYFPKFVLKI